MRGDLEIVKELESELGFELPKMRIGGNWYDVGVGEGTYRGLGVLSLMDFFWIASIES